jgi:DNA (cytosine-5)-methyltransferase 1
VALEVDYKTALSIVSNYPGKFKNVPKGELAAVLTHWLQNFPEKAPFMSDDEHQELSRYLLSELNTNLEDIRILFSDLPFQPIENPDFTFIDLFAGIGGFRIALQGFNGKCVFSSDWNKLSKATYFSNYGETPFGDLRLFTGPEISEEEIDALVPDHDVLCGGFPCQPFSKAGVSARTSLGRSHGFDDEKQGNLFFDIMRIVKVKKPRVLFLENVKNLKVHDGGNTFAVIKDTIENELGYKFHAEVIDARTTVPQKRQRCYMVAFRDNSVEFSYPSFDGEPIPLQQILEKTVDDSYTISDRLWVGHQNRTKRNLDRGTGYKAFEAELDKPANTLVARYYKDGKECLVPQEGKNPRMLTPRECARLMGFPDNFICYPTNPGSYRQFGNSLVVPVVAKIAENIVPHLRAKSKTHSIKVTVR